jgi:hypothetical protein
MSLGELEHVVLRRQGFTMLHFPLRAIRTHSISAIVSTGWQLLDLCSGFKTNLKTCLIWTATLLLRVRRDARLAEASFEDASDDLCKVSLFPSTEQARASSLSKGYKESRLLAWMPSPPPSLFSSPTSTYFVPSDSHSSSLRRTIYADSADSGFSASLSPTRAFPIHRHVPFPFFAATNSRNDFRRSPSLRQIHPTLCRTPHRITSRLAVGV